jgi:AAA domain/UvrD-like helicase C-terminal domain/PD-(D/E)XK nuclease superfamily
MENKYVFPQLSEEQKNVVKALKDNLSVKVSGVAGCGKTTNILGICSEHYDKNILVLTYNARLKIETREKVEKLGITNTEVHSYHAMCVRYYTHEGSKDNGIIKCIQNNIKPKKEVNFDIIILDECQDMTKCYYDFVCKIAKDNVSDSIQYCLFGDEQQNIFEFKGADERFLTHGHRIFTNQSKTEWKELKLSTSFRVTNQIASFINKYLIGYDKITACKQGDKVRYMYINHFRQKYDVYKEVLYYLNKGFKYDDIFILAPSIKKKTGLNPIVSLENMLVSNGHPCFAPVSDEAKIDEDVIKGKIVFSSFHQVKGLERPVVIVFNFDFSYFKYYARDAVCDKCPNIIYVATTRALKHLTVIHDSHNQPILPTITYDNITQDTNVYIVGGIMGRDEFGEICSKEQERIPVLVTELIRFLDPQVINNAIKQIDYITIPSETIHKKISLPQKATCTKKQTAEIVYDINGYAVPTFFEMTFFNRCSLLDNINYDKIDNKQKSNYDKIAYKYGQERMLSVKYLLYISTLYDASINGYIHRTKQITAYDWLTSEQLNNCCDILAHHIGNDDGQYKAFEVLYKDCKFLQTKYYLWGRIDIIDKKNDILWEIKCTSQTQDEHIIQLAIYAWMTYSKDRVKREYKLLNVCNNEVIVLVYDHDKITSTIDYLIKAKYEKKKILTDTEFIEACLKSST